MLPFQRFEWPHYDDRLVASIGMLITIPFFAFAEELFFRAWLTQTVGHYIRSTIPVVALVAVLFAAAHTQYDFRTKAQMMFDSVGLSALCLRDRRLELAIGAHSMMNLCVALQLLFFAGPLPHGQSPATSFDIWSIAILRSVLPYAMMYGLMQMTRGWYVPTAARLTIPGDIQPGHLRS
jgi:membrane protease YdiL (CAAX protease family)